MALVLGRWKRAASCVVLASSLVGSVSEASACEPPRPGWFPALFAPAPANGVVVVTYSCNTACETPPAVGSLSLRDAEGDLVPGSVVFSERRDSDLVIAFRPEPGALMEASVYTAELDGLPPLDGILVSPAVTWNDALAPTEQIFEVDHPRGETVCCKGPIDSCGNAPCFGTEVERRTTVTLRWDAPQSLEHYQYAARFGRDRIDPAAPWSWDFGNVRLELDAEEESFCYVLELKRLLDDSVQTFESRCIERPASFTPGIHRTPDEDIAQAIEFCDAPPDGYEKAWCEAAAETCEVSPDEPRCPEFAARCATIGTGGGGGTSERVLTKGCGCTLPGSGSREPASLVLAVALTALRLRRRALRKPSVVVHRTARVALE